MTRHYFEFCVHGIIITSF